MLVVSPAAAAAIEALLSSADLPEAAGLRLARGVDDVDGRPAAVTISVVDEPMSDDEIVPATGHHEVYIGRDVAGLVEDQVLDAEITDDVRFLLLPQPTNGHHPQT